MHVLALSHIILCYLQLFKIFMKLIDGCLVGSMDSSMNLIPEGSDDWSWHMHILSARRNSLGASVSWSCQHFLYVIPLELAECLSTQTINYKMP